MRETGPGPLRTARGAGRFALLGAGLRLGLVLPDDRDREPELFLGVLLLRDAGGEDVRVAMVGNVRDGPTSPTRHTPHDDALPGDMKEPRPALGYRSGLR